MEKKVLGSMRRLTLECRTDRLEVTPTALPTSLLRVLVCGGGLRPFGAIETSVFVDSRAALDFEGDSKEAVYGR